MKFLIIIPTLNERGNISIIYNKIAKLHKKAHILFIDDNSIDGSSQEILNIRKKDKKVNYIFRDKRLGIGSAHKIGIINGIKKKYRYILTMDCDGTHDPKYIEKMFKHLKENDMIITNRFLTKNSINGWDLRRKLITKAGYYLVRILLNSKLDSSGGFRLYDFKKVNFKHVISAKNNGFNFFFESTILLQNKKYKIFEIPIVLPKRVSGSSKMRLSDLFIGFYGLLNYFFKRLR